MRKILVSLVTTGLLLLSSGAHAGSNALLSLDYGKAIQPVPTGDLCPAGVAVDDGTFEDGFGVPNLFLGTPNLMVQRLVPSSYPAHLNKVCICWMVGGSGGGHMPFSVVTFADGAIPGQLQGSVETDSGTLLGGSTTFLGTSCAPMNVTLNSGGVYVGVKYNHLDEQDFYICGDKSASTPVAAMFSSINNGTAWHATTQDWPQLHAVGMRAEFGAVTSGCVTDNHTLCLLNGRIKVQAHYNTASSGSGDAGAVKLTDETGYFTFTSATSAEVMVKAINACGLNNHIWLYAGGLTDQGVTLTVTDTSKNPPVSKTYTSPLGTKWVTITDSSALATCP